MRNKIRGPVIEKRWIWFWQKSTFVTFDVVAFLVEIIFIPRTRALLKWTVQFILQWYHRLQTARLVPMNIFAGVNWWASWRHFQYSEMIARVLFFNALFPIFCSPVMCIPIWVRLFGCLSACQLIKKLQRYSQTSQAQNVLQVVKVPSSHLGTYRTEPVRDVIVVVRSFAVYDELNNQTRILIQAILSW